MTNRRGGFWILSAIGLLLGGRVASGGDVGFRLMDAASTGIDFRYTFGDFTYDNILESSGSGVSVFDADGDGLMDLYLLNGAYLEGIGDPKGRVFAGSRNRLYRNLGNFRFQDVSAASGLDDVRWSMAAVPYDEDGDGDVDVFLANYGPNAFYMNAGTGVFTDEAERMGLVGPDTLNGWEKWSVAGAVWDYDGDGDLDLTVGNFLAFDPWYLSPSAPHMMPHPNEYAGQATMMYRRADDGRYEEATKAAGLYYPDSKCMGLTLFDADGDGDLDLLQGNDHQANFLFRNRGDGTFDETGLASGLAVNDDGVPTGSMHGSLGDVDGDGLIDLLVVDLRHGALYRNIGEGRFEDITGSSGLRSAFDGLGVWGAALFDYDNDGDLDLFAANGRAEVLEKQLPLLLENDGAGHFRNVGPELGIYFQTPRSGRGAAVWDPDNDGDLDIVVSHVDLEGDPALLQNDGRNGNHWIGLRLEAQGGTAHALGATVAVEAGGRAQSAVHQPATGYLSFSDPRVHFGLGKADRIDRITVRWPDGSVDTLRDLEADRYLYVKQSDRIK